MIGRIKNAVARFFQPIRSSQYFTGIREFNKGNYEESAEALYLIRKGVYNTSILYRRLAEFYYHRSLRNLALIHFYDGDYNQCIIHCRRALEVDPGDKVSLNYLAHSFHHVGQYSSSIKNLRELFSLESEREDVLVNLAKILVKADEMREGILILDQLIEDNDRYADFFLIRGIAYAKLGESEQAIANYKHAISINPQFAKGQLLLGLEYIREFQYEAAHQVFAQGVENCPRDQEMLFYYGLVGNIIETIANMGIMNEIPDPSDPNAKLPAALLNDLTYLDDKVVSERLKNLDLDISYGEHFNFLDPIYDKPALKRLVEVFRQLIGDYPDYADYKYKLATFYIKLDEFDQAKFYLREALFLNPDYKDALLALMKLHEYEGEYDAAGTVSAKILALEPDNGEYHLNQGRIMLKMNQYEEAVNSMTTARMLDSRFNSHLYLLGFILMENQQYSLARAVWNSLKKVYSGIPRLIRRLDKLEKRDAA